jgi:hypothetical protein
MNINYKLQGVKPIKKLSVRFYHHKFDLSTVTNIMLMVWWGFRQPISYR